MRTKNKTRKSIEKLSPNFDKMLSSKPARMAASSILLTVGLFGIPNAHAEENGATQWPLGVQTIAPALLPPPGGTEFYNYTLFYQAFRSNDSNGHSAAPGFNFTVEADAGRIVHTWNTNINGLNLSSGVILAGDHLDLHVAGLSGHTTGLDYVYLTPLYLTYQVKAFHFLFGPSLFIPTGHYGARDVVNSTNNYYSFGQELAVTYLPSPRLELSAESVITVNGTNDVTHYHSGSLIDTDFAANYAPFSNIPNLQLGFNGYYAQQLDDDTIGGVKYGDGYRLQKVAVGPQAIYYFNQATAVVLKWQHEVIAKNGPQGDKIWIEFALPI